MRTVGFSDKSVCAYQTARHALDDSSGLIVGDAAMKLLDIMKYVVIYFPATAVFMQQFRLHFRRFRKSAINDYYSHVCLSVCLSVRPHGTTRLPVDEFSCNLIGVFFENLSRQFKFR